MGVAIVSPSDSFKETTSRILVALQMGLLQETLNRSHPKESPLEAGQTAHSDDLSEALLPSGNLLDPFKGQTPAMIAQIKTKVAPFAPIIHRLSTADTTFRALERELEVLENIFTKIDLSGSGKPDLKNALLTKDRDRQFKVSQLVEKSAKVRADILALRDSLQEIPPKLKNTEEPNATSQSLVIEKNKQIREALKSPSATVHPSIIKTLEARLFNEVENPLAKMKNDLKKLNERVKQQAEETKVLAPETAKQTIDSAIRPD